MAPKKAPQSPRDLIQLLAEIPPQQKYTKEDRYHDFRQLFTGTEQGQRVYAEILSWAHLFQSSVPPGEIDVNRVFVREGERNIGLRLLATVNIEPPLTPEKQSRKSKGESDEA